jgi:hypothetical protein
VSLEDRVADLEQSVRQLAEVVQGLVETAAAREPGRRLGALEAAHRELVERMRAERERRSA